MLFRSTTFGDFGNIGDGYSHSMVLDIALSDNLNYVIQSDILNAEDSVLGAEEFADEFNLNPNDVFPLRGRSETVGINQYLFYTISDRLAVGGRAEWWKADGESIYALTGGVNIRPTANLVIRPEIRYQWNPGDGQSLGTDGDGNFIQVDDIESDGDAIFGIDAVYTF